MTRIEIGCCGAYCRTCKEFSGGLCNGCKLGYDTGERNIERARCRIKLCCFKDNEFQTCIDCDKFNECEILQTFYSKGDRKRYGRSLEYIRENGYDAFIKVADFWKNAKGRL